MTKVIPNRHKGQAERILRYIPFLLAVFLWCILAFKEQYYLKKVEDLSVFLYDKLFLIEWFKTPGGFLGLAGSFLTQFMHLPWLGALLWVLLLLVSYQLTIRIFNIPDSYRPLALIPVALLVIGNMSLGYGVFIMREQDHFFAPLLGYLASLIPLAVTARMKETGSKILFLTLWTAAGFPLLGTFAFTGVLVVAIATLVRPGLTRKERLTVFVSAIALIAFVPLIIYSAYTSYRMADSWIMGLPSISDDLWTRAMRTPFQLALLCQPILALISSKLSSKPLENLRKTVIQSAIYIMIIASVWGFWFKDENFHTELAMSEAVDRYDWDRTIDLFQKAVKSHTKSDAKAYAARTKKIASASSADEISDIVDRFSKRFFEPTRTMVLYRDLALLKTDRALDAAFTMKDGGRKQKSRTQIPMAWQSGKQFYLQYGLVNMSYRWCLEDVIEHYWSYSTLKYMAMHSVIMHEEEFAHKYINKLSKTLFYRRWAKEQMILAHDSTLMAITAPYDQILPYMCFENRMTNDMVKTEVFLMRHFSEPEPPHATPEYDRAALFWAMRIQNISAFWMHLYYYIQSNKVVELPRGVEEAACLYSNLEKRGLDLPYSKTVTDRYDAFQRFAQKNPVRNTKESSYPYYQKFGNTFFYYYYFTRDLKTY